MNIKTKTKSPTVIIIEQATMDETKNDRVANRMDSLEKKLDNQYKAYTDKTKYVKLVDSLQKSFMSGLDKILSINKSLVSKINDSRIDNLKKEMTVKLDYLSQNRNDELLKALVKQVGGLQKSLKNIPQPKIVNRTVNLSSSFDKYFARLEEVIKSCRPRMYPSPS